MGLLAAVRTNPSKLYVYIMNVFYISVSNILR